MDYGKKGLLSLLFLASSLYASESGWRPKKLSLHVAIQQGLFDMIPDRLLLGTMNIEDRDEYQRTALHAACVARNPEYAPEKQNALKECIKMLLDRAPSSLINEKDWLGNSALYDLVPTKYLVSDSDLFATFLNYGADPNNENTAGRVCLDDLHENLKKHPRDDVEKSIFVSTYKIVRVLDEHDKQLEQRVREKAIDQALEKIMSCDVARIISGYACCGVKLNLENRRKLEGILILPCSTLFELLCKEGHAS